MEGFVEQCEVFLFLNQGRPFFEVFFSQLKKAGLGGADVVSDLLGGTIRGVRLFGFRHPV